MAYLITEDPIFLDAFFKKDKDDCTFGYKAYAANRKMISFDEAKFKTSRTRFIDHVVKPITEISGGQIMLGRYFVYKVSDIKAMLEESCDCDYVHLHNRVDDQGYNKLVMMPYKSTEDNGQERKTESETLGDTTILLEALPCPPHPFCPIF
jgi:hypothetical protein